MLTSPRVRALDTARLACRALALEPIVVDESEAAGERGAPPAAS